MIVCFFILVFSFQLLDAVLSLMDTLMVFEETPNDEEWAEMVQMCFKILLECASSENLEVSKAQICGCYQLNAL